MTRATVLLVLFAGACAARSVHVQQLTPAAAVVPAPLTQSLFSRDPQGQLTEPSLQRILAAPLEVDFPARVGVLPILTATSWRGPGPDYARVPAGAGPLLAALRGAEQFSLLTAVMPIPSGALGMEALREIAARYQLRYLLLYREMVDRHTRANAWTAGYITLLGALFLPGRTLEVGGYIEASLFDVKTGLLLFTVRRRVHAERTSNEWSNERKLDLLRDKVVAAEAPDLAKEVRSAAARFAEAAALENKRRAAPAAAVTGARAL
jgi:hypothetical protein